MTPATIQFHETLIRLLKGVCSAWEKWLESQKST
jgi:hypothetical protein